MFVHPNKILPSQDFLKEDTVKYILKCIHDGEVDKLPPCPIVRIGQDGKLVAIDGHNLIAVRLYLNEDIDVIIADSPEPILPSYNEASEARNSECGINSIWSWMNKKRLLKMAFIASKT